MNLGPKQILGIVVALIVSFFVWRLFHRGYPWAWRTIVFIARNRYCLLTITLPALLMVLGFFGPLKGMLHGLFILRDSKVFLGLYSWDLFWVTCWSLVTVGVGFSGMRIVELHGDARMGTAESLLDPNPIRLKMPQEKIEEERIKDDIQNRLGDLKQEIKKSQPAKGWSWGKISIWLFLGLVFPVGCAVYSNAEGIPNDLATDSFISVKPVVLGVIATCLTIILIALGKRWLLGTAAPAVGILPFEFEWGYAGPPSFLKSAIEWAFVGPNTGLAALLNGPGYTGPDQKLLPGHAHMTLLGLVAAFFYIRWYTNTLNFIDTGFTVWPPAYYLLVLVFFIGLQMAGISFWVDRFGVPPTVVVIAWMAMMYRTGAADHYFEVFQPTGDLRDQVHEYHDKKFLVAPMKREQVISRSRELAGKDIDVREQDPSLLAQLTNRTKADDTHYLDEPPEFVDVFKNWKFPKGPNGTRTLVIVTAPGGGIQAAAWVTEVLTGLDRDYEGFSESIGLISSVSGGSVGSLFYFSHRGVRQNSETTSGMVLSEDSRKEIVNLAEASSMDSVTWGVAFPDFVRSILPPFASKVFDRGWSLESAWWNRMGRDFRDRGLMQETRIRDLIPPILDGRMPVVVFNATAVETGQRTLISPVNMNKKKDIENQELVQEPINFIEFYNDMKGLNGDTKVLKPNPRLTTAVRLSASFSYVAPVARPFEEDENTIKEAVKQAAKGKGLNEKQSQEMVEKISRRARLHFCDGGYSDNPGIVTAVRATQDLLEYYDSVAEADRPFDQVLFVRIEAFPLDVAKAVSDNSGFASAIFGPATATSATRISSQAERAGLEVDLLRKGRGGKENGKISVDSVTFRFQPVNPDGKPAESPPLSWTLTPSEKQKIKDVWKLVKDENKKESSDSLTRAGLTGFFAKRQQ